MSLKDLGKNDISEETQALKDKLASRDTECAGLHTQLMRREAELEELRVTLNETVYKLSKEAERALQLEEEVSTRSSELKTERMSLRNTELALQSAQDRLKAEERAKRELESTLDTVSHHSQTTSAEHQSVQREKRALESRVRELERIVQTHESRRVSNVPRKGGRSRSSSVSNFRPPAVEQELSDTKAQLHTTETRLRTLEQKLSKAQDDLVKAENARISIDKTSQKRISELVSDMERKEEELESLRVGDNAGEREEELMKRIDEDAAKITALEKLVADSPINRTSQAKIQKLQSQLKVECEKAHRSEELQGRLLQEKEELVRKYEASEREIREGRELLTAREYQINELEARHAHLVAELESHSCRKESSLGIEHSSSLAQGGNAAIAFTSESALADHIQTLLQAIDRLRDERDGLKRALEFSEVEYRITTEGFEARVASLTRKLAESAYVTAADKSPIDAHKEQRIKNLTSCAAAFSVVISNLQTHLDLSEDRLSATIADLTSSNSQLHDALAVIDCQKQLLTTNAHDHDVLDSDATAKELSESNEERERLRLHLSNVEGQVASLVERAEASETAFTTLSKNCQDVESERNSLALQVTNLRDDLARIQGELADAQTRYNALHAQQLSEMPASKIVQALKGRIQELEERIVYYTEQIGDYQHDVRRLEANVKLHEERIAEIVPELELLASQKETMVEDCAEAREARNEAIERLEVAEEEAERFQQQLLQMKNAHDGELSAMLSTMENLESEKQQAVARLSDLEAENAGFGDELDALRHDHQGLGERLDDALSCSRSLEMEITEEKTGTQQAVVSFAIVYCAYKDSARRLQKSYQCIATLESRLVDLSRDVEQQRAFVDSAKEEKHGLLQRLSDISGATEGPQDDLVSHRDEIDLLRGALQAKEQELASTRQMLEEAESRHSEVKSELVGHIATMSDDLQVQAGQVERVTTLQEEVESLRKRLRSSLENFADLERLHDEVVQEFAATKEVFERRLIETDEQIRILDADHQQSLSAIEAKYRYDTDMLTGNLEDREHEMDELRQELQDMSEEHARAEENLRSELKAFEARHALASDRERDLQRTITDMSQQLMQAETDTLALQEEITGLQAEIQRSTSLTRYLENRIGESEDARLLLKKSLQRSELSLAESEKASKAAEFELTLQTTQHEKVVTALRHEITSLQSGPDLRSALADLEEKNRDMDNLLRAKCQEIEEYDDRILETLKTNKKLAGKVESLTRKVQGLHAKLSSMKNQHQEPATEVTPPKKASPVSSPSVSTPATSYAGSHPDPAYPVAHIRESSVPSMTLRSKTPEPRAQPAVVLPVPRTHSGRNELSGCDTSAGKKRRAPDDDERDGIPAEGHYSSDVGSRNGPTPRLRRTHGHPGGFTPVRGASVRKPVSPGRRTNVVAMPSEIITDVTNSPRGPLRQGDAQLKKKGWLGKIRGGAGSQPPNSRLGTFGGQ